MEWFLVALASSLCANSAHSGFYWLYTPMQKLQHVVDNALGLVLHPQPALYAALPALRVAVSNVLLRLLPAAHHTAATERLLLKMHN